MQAIKTAICSYGMSGLVFHGPLLEVLPGFRVEKILERSKTNSAGKHPGAVIVRSYAEILDDPGIELVVVNTPDHLHTEMCRGALEAGKHVVVEKPFTLRAEEAESLIELAREKGLVLSVFQNRRWDGDFMTVKEIIEKGLLGRLVEFESHFDRYRNYIKPSWKDQSTGTGTLYNLGSHLIDQALQLFGLPDYLYCDVRMLRDGALTDDSYDLFLHYPDVKCLLRSSYLVRKAGPRFILHGVEGSYRKWGVDPQEASLNAGQIPGGPSWGMATEDAPSHMLTNFRGEHIEGPYPTLAGDYLAYYRNIFSAIRQGAELAVHPEESLDVIRVIEAAYQSARESRVVRLD
ncbi:MAG: oxidoreductase [Bacteroidetes bacterium]|nr:MAG: oxidoreductase [Bacteroidota bacterium]